MQPISSNAKLVLGVAADILRRAGAETASEIEAVADRFCETLEAYEFGPGFGRLVLAELRNRASLASEPNVQVAA